MMRMATSMALLDWHGPGRVIGVVAVMLGVQILDGTVITYVVTPGDSPQRTVLAPVRDDDGSTWLEQVDVPDTAEGAGAGPRTVPPPDGRPGPSLRTARA